MGTLELQGTDKRGPGGSVGQGIFVGFTRIYDFRVLKLTSPSPRSAPRRKGCQFQLEAAGVTPKGAAEATRSTE